MTICRTNETCLPLSKLPGVGPVIATALVAAALRCYGTVDLIYIHFDVDALDQSEVASKRLSEPNGPMRTALEIIMAYPKVAAFGIADINPKIAISKPGTRSGASRWFSIPCRAP